LGRRSRRVARGEAKKNPPNASRRTRVSGPCVDENAGFERSGRKTTCCWEPPSARPVSTLASHLDWNHANIQPSEISPHWKWKGQRDELTCRGGEARTRRVPTPAAEPSVCHAQRGGSGRGPASGRGGKSANWSRWPLQRH